MSVVAEGWREAPYVESARRAAPSFAEFYAEQWPDVAGFCGALVGSQVVGDDLAQEAFTRLCTRWPLVREPRPYVFRIARNLAHRHHRAAAHEVLVDATPDHPNSAAEGPRVLDAVRGLPERLQVVVLLHYYADLPVADVAKSLRRPVGSVKRQLHEARAVLSRSLGDEHV
jgi:RNA polymerase sigma-70 factor (ECF subfamily)